MDFDELALSALVGAGDILPRKKISRDDQQLYLEKYIAVVSVDDRTQIAAIIVSAGLRDYLHACPEGVVIDLSRLSDDVVRKMYDLLDHIRHRPTQEIL